MPAHTLPHDIYAARGEKKIEVSARCPVSFWLVDSLESIRHAIHIWVVWLDLCASTITAVPGHAHPEVCDIFGRDRRGARQECVIVAGRGWFATPRKSLLVTTHIPDIGLEMLRKQVYEREEYPVGLVIRHCPREGKCAVQLPINLPEPDGVAFSSVPISRVRPIGAVIPTKRLFHSQAPFMCAGLRIGGRFRDNARGLKFA
jgi:hypothetical protein